MRYRYIKIIFLSFLVTVLISGCSFSLSSSSKDGGVYKSFDYGENFEQKNLLKSDDEQESSIDSINTREIIFDDSDHKLVFLASRENGVFMSTDGAESWQRIFPKAIVYSIDTDPVNRGIVYVSTGNRVYKTIDMGQNWQVVYLESRKGTAVTQVVVDPKNSKKILLATSGGEVFESLDTGESWNLLSQVKGYIRKLLVNNNNPEIVYAATLKKGLYKSIDGGKNFEDISKSYLSINSSNKQFRAAVLDVSSSDGLFLVTKYGILRTTDGGISWQDLSLLTPKKSVLINAFAINPKDTKEMYYATEDIIYRTFDSGQTWLSTKVSSQRMPVYLVVDPETANVIYMGVMEIDEKPFFFL